MSKDFVIQHAIAHTLSGDGGWQIWLEVAWKEDAARVALLARVMNAIVTITKDGEFKTVEPSRTTT